MILRFCIIKTYQQAQILVTVVFTCVVESADFSYPCNDAGSFI